MAGNEQSDKGLEQDAQKLIKSLKQWVDTSESHFGIPEYWRSLTHIVQELQAKELLARSSEPRMGEMVLRLESNGSPILLEPVQ